MKVLKGFTLSGRFKISVEIPCNELGKLQKKIVPGHEGRIFFKKKVLFSCWPGP